MDVQGKPGLRGAWAWSSTKTGPEVPLPTQGLRPQGDPGARKGVRVPGSGAWALEAEEQRGCEPAGRTLPACPHQGSTRARVTAKGSTSPAALSKHCPPRAQSSRGRLRPSSSALPQGLWAPTLPDLHPIPARTLQHGKAGQLPASHLAPWGQLSTPSLQTPGAPQ